MNTYGEHGNAMLLRKYGFCIRGNPFTEVVLDKADLQSQAEAAFLSDERMGVDASERLAEWKRRIAWIE